jgi:hypothetical protein
MTRPLDELKGRRIRYGKEGMCDPNQKGGKRQRVKIDAYKAKEGNIPGRGLARRKQKGRETQWTRFDNGYTHAKSVELQSQKYPKACVIGLPDTRANKFAMVIKSGHVLLTAMAMMAP